MAIATTVRVKIPAMFQSATGGVKTAEVGGKTVGECLKALSVKFPALKRMLFDDGDNFSGYLAVMVNGQSVTGNLYEIPVKAGDELYPLMLIEGG